MNAGNPLQVTYVLHLAHDEMLYIEVLHRSLQSAVKGRIIQSWTTKDRHVVFVHLNGESVSVPLLKAGEYLSELYTEHERAEAF